MTHQIRPNRRLKVLITSPSLVENENVSGISTLVKAIIEEGKFEFVHFPAGRKDLESVRPVWLLRQILLPLRFAWAITRQRVDLIHINTALSSLSIFRDFMLTLTARFFGFPVLLHIHGGPFMRDEISGHALSWLTRELLQSADCVAVLSEEEEDVIHRRWKNSPIRVLPNAVKFDPVRRDRTENKQAKITFLGRIDNNKGLREIEQACGILQDHGLDFVFTCYGTGPAAVEFATSMSEMLGKRFAYGGIVSGNEKRAAFAKTDIFVLPSYFEGLPIALLEAMAAGCLVVASDVGSISTVVRDGVNGFLVEPHDGPRLAEKLEMLISDLGNMSHIADNARRTIEKRFSMDTFLAELVNIYSDIVRNDWEERQS